MPGRQILTATGAGELRRLASDLRAAGNQQSINADLRRELMALGRKGAAAVRTSVRSTPSKGQSGRAGRRSLRSAIARATEAKVRTSVRPGVVIWVNPAQMPTGERALPGYLDGQGRWRHPVFGNTDVWRGQRPHPYFDRAVNPIAGQLADAGDKVLDRIADIIERG
jgi:hypothetical protein